MNHDSRPTWKKIADRVIMVILFILIAYVIMSWIPPLRDGVVGDILGMIVGPVINLIPIPPVGELDLRVLVLYFALTFVQRRFLR